MNMPANSRLGLLVTAIIGGAIVIGTLVAFNSRVSTPAELAKAHAVAVSAKDHGSSLPKIPATHPPVQKPPPEADAPEGKVAVDPTRSFTHFRVGNNTVTAIYEDGSAMWLGTSVGMVRYDTRSLEFKSYDSRNGLQAKGILSLGKVRGKISVGTYGGGLWLLDRTTQEWESYGTAEGLADAYVYDVAEAANGDIWIATGAGVHRVRGGRLKETAQWDLFTVATTAGGLPHDRVQRIVEARDGSIWIATRGGIGRFSSGKWESWTHAKGLGVVAQDAVKSAPNLPTAGTGQSNRAAAINPDHVTSLEVGGDGNVWAGTLGGGLARHDGKTWRNYTTRDGLPSDQVTALSFDPKGRLWIGTRSGLAVLSSGKFQIMGTAQGLLGDNVYSVAATRDGDVWVGSLGGVALLRQPASVPRPPSAQVPNNQSPTHPRSS